ncbi:VRR-NUC domain-containing protein [Arthrobacter castelli]|uniref:VRR-NUC domain-containing protein n=1 Tax=Arthrobacter castelli TaxID=271431 RepID=UPI00047D8895|nr:VRR-NUC domain-containing protein [Arthrobacter castelli]
MSTATREDTVEKYLLTRCRANGFLCMKFVSPARGGVPDRVIITPAETVFVETKRPGGKPRRLQKIVHTKMRRYGAKVYVADDRHKVDELIRELATKK